MTKVIMEIIHDNKKANLYSLLTYEQWFDSHQYGWRCKNRTFRDRPSKELTDTYQKAITRHLKWQGRLIKAFMQNCNGKRPK